MPDVVDLIMADHREVERLFETLRAHVRPRNAAPFPRAATRTLV